MTSEQLQIWADCWRVCVAERLKVAAGRDLDRHAAVRKTIGDPWTDLIPPAVFWLFGPHELALTRAKRTDFHPSMRQIDAQTRCKGAWAALTPLQRPIVSWVVDQLGHGGRIRRVHPHPPGSGDSPVAGSAGRAG